MVNPRARELVSDDELAELIRHEIVHVATRSPDSPAPTWAVEGLAEWVALDRASGRSSPGVVAVLAAVRRDGPPAMLPGEADFAVGATGLNQAYAAGLAGLPLRRRGVLGAPISAGSTPSWTPVDPWMRPAGACWAAATGR